MARFSVTSIFNSIKPVPKPPVMIPEQVWRDPRYFIAFGLGSGAMPFAPGTFGTLMAIPFYLLLRPLPILIYILFTIAFIAFSSWLCQKISDEIKVSDHVGMCIDEFAGFFVTMIGAPAGVSWIILGFLLFRFFDICKPWPIRKIDNSMHSGFGMVLDDVVAGIFALVVLQIIYFLCTV